ncbi:MAG TPA: hypothetical protein VJ961_09825 [Mariprofundaceae bacterium]|nr:hypothetical protein [Mariprofundaceae bacterium]
MIERICIHGYAQKDQADDRIFLMIRAPKQARTGAKKCAYSGGWRPEALTHPSAWSLIRAMTTLFNLNLDGLLALDLALGTGLCID